MSVDLPPRTMGPMRGFTLVEVMVALAILSLILLSTITALRTFGTTQATLDRTIERIDEVRTVSSFLRDQLGAASIGLNASGLTLGGGVDEGSFFRGSAKSLEWKANIKFGESFGGNYLLRVVQLDDELTLQWLPVSMSTHDLDWEGASSRRLIAGVQAFELAYRTGFSEDWQAELDAGTTPALVRMRISTRGRYWPDLIMEVPR
ncbi:prepilin-type N-terminal cleavage/methylation domain-containing protein [Parahaliea aestuarii]|uniref:Prepilin-type N-terminal cleavage/methylation domain-containing protein n=1 Tax=Parahaliea aestuarii TaxID=1852021 RepID=A0A5C8ZR24_9GAMM|nr:prepilin-type N-terminal cleavage/methylation domain-containing protein [Parahaliea aestuarii]TXS90072.1 prepilin-type N-terminal cleavage/methylation domain-containing protein [Parahaliea aestuarii]